MTRADCERAIRQGTPAWVRHLQDLAILIRVSRLGDAVLIRYAYGTTNYQWVDTALLTRADDHDADPEPVWLRKARLSGRPPAILWDLLHPTYASYALARPEEVRGFAFDTDPDGRVRE